MSNVLDLKVGAALMRLRLIERALHDRGSWEMEYAGTRVPLSRFLKDDRVIMVAHFPAMCPLDPQEAVSIMVNGEHVWTVALDEPLPEDGCSLYYDMALQDPVLV
jgi:hypothetical protein